MSGHVRVSITNASVAASNADDRPSVVASSTHTNAVRKPGAAPIAAVADNAAIVHVVALPDAAAVRSSVPVSRS